MSPAAIRWAIGANPRSRNCILGIMAGQHFQNIRPIPDGDGDRLHRDLERSFSVYNGQGADATANRPTKRRRAIVACSTCRDRKTRVGNPQIDLSPQFP